MNKKLYLLCIIVVIGVGGFFINVQAADYNYEKFKMDITINKDSTFDVVENQTYRLNGNFGFFYRDIKLQRLDHISDLEVYDEANNKIDIEDLEINNSIDSLYVKWNFERRDFSDELKSWTIKYKVHGGLGFYREYDELYWNAIFSDREADVKFVEVTVHLPEEFDDKQVGKLIYFGSEGSKSQSYNYQQLDRKTVLFFGGCHTCQLVLYDSCYLA